MGTQSTRDEPQSLRRELLKPVIRAAGIVTGIIGAADLFVFLLGQSFELGEGLELATGLLPVLTFCGFILLFRRNLVPPLRWFLLDFSLGAAGSFLVMNFVVARHVL
ncbi:MAG: hypothetical protein GY953_06180 [bacterium]|nr:hypothetical protein [bacterium]